MVVKTVEWLGEYREPGDYLLRFSGGVSGIGGGGGVGGVVVDGGSAAEKEETRGAGAVPQVLL